MKGKKGKLNETKKRGNGRGCCRYLVPPIALVPCYVCSGGEVSTQPANQNLMNGK
jgi:hypothetical protein